MRIARGDELHRTRLHDEKGNALARGELRHLPHNLLITARRRISGTLPPVPWIPFNAISRLDQLLEPSWNMIEFGSGMSTAWYAKRVASIHSIESDTAWYQRIALQLPGNARYELRDLERYCDLSEYPENSLDFAVIDGMLRDQCAAAVIPKVKGGGWIYLDNSDKDMTIPNGEVRQAETLIRAAAAHVETQTGLTVGMLVAQEWLLAQLPK